MGFFSDLKEDLSQAVNELMPEEEQIKADNRSIDEMLENIDKISLPGQEADIPEQGTEENVEAAAEDGSRMTKREQELFSFQTPTGWTKLSSKKNGDNQVYVYAYNEILKPEQTTSALFDSVKFLNIIEGQLDEQNLTIPVRAYAIQASYTGGDSGSVIDQAKTAYEKYVNQNKDQEGQVTP